MRMSCNGCRVLRKGCSENCSIRPCLQWIKSSESQSNATVFLAKFYGRAGLMNLINAGPDHLRPAIFKSLLYEACGRIVNPIYGSVGLLWSGNWQLCQEAAESVLRGTPIIPIASDSAACTNPPPIKDYDIRHVIKDDHDSSASPTAASGGKKDLRRVHNSSNRSRFKKSGGSSTKNPRHSKESATAAACFESAAAACLASMMSNREWGMNSHNNNNDDNNNHRSMSHDSSTLSHGGCGDTTDQSMGSSHTAAHDPLPIFVVAAGDNLDMEMGGGTVRGSYNDGSDDEEKKDGELELELTLGFHQPVQARRSTS